MKQTIVRLTDQEHRALRAEADRLGVSLSWFMLSSAQAAAGIAPRAPTLSPKQAQARRARQAPRGGCAKWQVCPHCGKKAPVSHLPLHQKMSERGLSCRNPSGSRQFFEALDEEPT